MSTSGLEGIDHTIQLTHLWINELNDLLGWDNKPRAYRLLRAVLHAVRDWLQVNDAAHLGAQLPMLLRGIYYEDWRPAGTPVKKRDKAAFLTRIDHAFVTDPMSDTADAVTAVFRLLSDRLTGGEVDKVRHALPSDLRAIWPVEID